jgi:hypothetical protein
MSALGSNAKSVANADAIPPVPMMPHRSERTAFDTRCSFQVDPKKVAVAV